MSSKDNENIESEEMRSIYAEVPFSIHKKLKQLSIDWDMSIKDVLTKIIGDVKTE